MEHPRLIVRFLLSVDRVAIEFATFGERADFNAAVIRAGVASLARVPFSTGSMAPKVRAAGARAAIGRLEDAAEILARRAGTRVLAELGGATFW